MMDVQSTNHSTLTSWSQVKRRATHHNTPTYEDMIDLCNKANRPLHMQIMHLFYDASVQAQADFIELFHQIAEHRALAAARGDGALHHLRV